MSLTSAKEIFSFRSKFFYLCVLTLLLVRLTLANANSVYAHTPSADPLRDVDFKQNLNKQVPLDLAFQDELGHSTQFSHYFNQKPVILVFAYYECPNLCSLALEDLVKSLKALPFDVGNQFEVITVSIDPTETHTQAATAKAIYTERYARPGAADRWHFLTGTHTAIDQLADAVGFEYAYDTKKKQYAHAAGMVILTPEGKISRYLYGLDYSPRDLRLGLVDASANKIGSWVDQLLLLCYQYDPVTGQYTPYVMNVIRVAGVITILVIGGAIAFMLRQERPKSSIPR